MSLDGFTLSNASRETVQKILSHPRLEFHAKVDLRRQIAYDYIQEAKYKGLHLKVLLPPYRPTVFICGNFYHFLHSLPNTGDFPFAEFLESVDLLSQEFHLKAEETKVVKLEVGCNISTPVHPREVIDNILAYKGRQKQFRDYKERGYEGVFDFQEYLIRLYCKSCKNKLSAPVLRIELASEKSRYLKKHGIHHLSDLRDVKRHKSLGRQLMAHAGDFIYDDLELDLSQLTHEEARVVQQYRRPQAWRDLMEQSPENYRKKKRRHRAIIDKYSRSNWRLWLQEQMGEAMQRGLGVGVDV